MSRNHTAVWQNAGLWCVNHSAEHLNGRQWLQNCSERISNCCMHSCIPGEGVQQLTERRDLESRTSAHSLWERLSGNVWCGQVYAIHSPPFMRHETNYETNSFVTINAWYAWLGESVCALWLPGLRWPVQNKTYAAWGGSQCLEMVKRHLYLASEYLLHTCTHTIVYWPFSGTTRVSRYQKGKTNLDFTETTDGEWQWHQLGHMQVCTSLQTDNHASTPPQFFYRPDALPAAQPTASKHWRHCIHIKPQNKPRCLNMMHNNML